MKKMMFVMASLLISSAAFAQSTPQAEKPQEAPKEISVDTKHAEKGGCCASMAAKSCCSKDAAKSCDKKETADRPKEAPAAGETAKASPSVK